MNIIDTIRVSGTDYTLSATSSGGITSGEVQTMIDESVSGITERMAEDEEVTAAALNNLNDRISGISGNNAVEVTQAEYDALVSGGTVDPTAFYIITDATPVDISNYWTSAQTQSAINQATAAKQDTLVSGTNIKTINNESILGSGNIDIQGGGVNVVQTTGTSTTDVMSQDAVTTQLNNKANKTAAVGGYKFGSINNTDYLQYTNVNNDNIGNSIYYPKINGKGILTNNSTWAQNNYNFQLVEASAITTTITSGSTNTQVPSAKAMYDKFDEVEQVTAAALNELNDKIGNINTILESI